MSKTTQITLGIAALLIGRGVVFLVGIGAERNQIVGIELIAGGSILVVIGIGFHYFKK